MIFHYQKVNIKQPKQLPSKFLTSKQTTNKFQDRKHNKLIW